MNMILLSERPAVFLGVLSLLSLGIDHVRKPDWQASHNHPVTESQKLKKSNAQRPQFFERWRTSFLERTSIRDPSGLVRGIFLGESEWISPEITNRFRNAGLMHLLSASGFNCMITAGFFAVISRLFLQLSGRFIGTHLLIRFRKYLPRLSVLIGAWTFFLWSNQTTPILRAAVMATTVSGLAIAGIQPPMHRILFIHLFGFTILDPKLWSNNSFLLTFGCLFGICAAAKLLRYFRLEGRFLIPSLVTSCGACVGVIPVTWHSFGEINFNGVLTNLFAIPVTAWLTMPAAFLTMLLCFPPVHLVCSTLAERITLLAHSSCELLMWLIAHFETLGIGFRYVD